MIDKTTLALGLFTLIGSLVIGFSMEYSGTRSLTDDQRRYLFQVKYETRFFRWVALGLLVVYLAVRLVSRSASPDWNHASVLCLWTSYNLVLWAKMRKMMNAFVDVAFPVNFQISYLFSQIISYTGLVSSMLVLLHGRAL